MFGDYSGSAEIAGILSIVYDGNDTVLISVGGKTSTLGQFTNAGVMMMDKGGGSGGWLALKADNTSPDDFKLTTFSGFYNLCSVVLIPLHFFLILNPCLWPCSN